MLGEVNLLDRMGCTLQFHDWSVSKPNVSQIPIVETLHFLALLDPWTSNSSSISLQDLVGKRPLLYIKSAMAMLSLSLPREVDTMVESVYCASLGADMTEHSLNGIEDHSAS